MEPSIRVDAELLLTPLREDDAEELFALVQRNRDHFRRWLPWVAHTRSVEDERAFIALDREERALRAGITFGLRADGLLVGTIGLQEVVRVHEVGAVGYMLGEEFSRRGLMTRALRAVKRFALEDYGLHRLELLVALANVRSSALAERCGFAFEAVLRERLRAPSGYDDCALYVALAAG